MNLYPHDVQIAMLQAKGGMMFFTVERPKRVYKGAVLLSPVNSRGDRTRIVCAKVYRYKEQGGVR